MNTNGNGNGKHHPEEKAKAKKRNIEPVAKVYAQALFDLAQEQNKVDELLKSFSEFVEFLNSQEDLVETLASRTFTSEQREKLVLELAKKINLDGTLTKLLHVFTLKNRLSVLQDTLRAFQFRVDQSKGIVRGTVTTVEPLSDEQREDLAKHFSKKLNKHVELETRIDKEILGGLIVQVQGLTFDGSLKTTIRSLKENLERQSL